MSKPNGNRAGLFIAALSICLLIPQIVSAQYTAKEQKAIDAVASFFSDMGDKDAANKWRNGWGNGLEKSIYKFKILPKAIEAQVTAGHEEIDFGPQMVEQILGNKGLGHLDQKRIADWAATYKHELVHTKQDTSGWTGSEDRYMAGQGHPYEAIAWGQGLKSYWDWLKIANSNYSQAKLQEDKNKYAQQVLPRVSRLVYPL